MAANIILLPSSIISNVIRAGKKGLTGKVDTDPSGQVCLSHRRTKLQALFPRTMVKDVKNFLRNQIRFIFRIPRTVTTR